MTRRILLTLADDATDTRCGSCDYIHDVTAWCVPFWDGAAAGAGGIRDPRCTAAEAAAARMVEIAPEDAAALGPWVVTGGYTDEHTAAADRIERALEAHGKAAR